MEYPIRLCTEQVPSVLVEFQAWNLQARTCAAWKTVGFAGETRAPLPRTPR